MSWKILQILVSDANYLHLLLFLVLHVFLPNATRVPFVAGDFLHQKVDLKNLNSKPKYRVLSQTLAEAIKGTPYVLAWTALGSV